MNIKSFFREYSIVFLVYIVVAAVTVFIFKYILMLNIIPSASMENTIMTGDVVIASRWDRETVNRYDVMVFVPEDEPDKYYIKRVIGMPGETIVVDDGKVYADGVELDDEFIAEAMNSSGDGTYKVPENCYFMMGDNRNESFDSRFWDSKYVPLENMTAKARIII